MAPSTSERPPSLPERSRGGDRVSGPMSRELLKQEAPGTAAGGVSAPATEDYQAKLMTAAEAARLVESGSTIAMGLSPCQPPGVLKALADRARAKDIERVKVYYSVSGRHLRNSLLRFEFLRRFEPYCLFFGATER